MTTADLIKKREEEKNNPVQENKPSVSVPPVQGMNMAQARMHGNGVGDTDMQESSSKPVNTVSLYDDGVNFGNIAKEAAIKNLITTPEYEKFRNEVIGAQQFGVETPEQAAARERRDYIKQGLTGFTEGLSALANLYYTTKGAPSQKYTSQMPVLQERLYRERLERDKKLENFRAWQRSKADKEEERAYQEKLRGEEMAYRQQQAKENLRRWKAEFEEAKKRNATQLELQRIKLGMDQAQQEFDNTLKKQTLAETRRHNQAMETNAATKAAGSRSSSVLHGKNGTSILNTKNGFMDVDWKKVDPIAKRQLYDSVPEEIREKYPLKDEYGEYDEKYATSQMNAAIAEAAIGNENIAKWLVDSKAGVYQQQSEPSKSGKEEEQKPSVNKYDSYDITGNSSSIDFSKQKRQRGGAEATSATTKMVNAVPSQQSNQQVSAAQPSKEGSFDNFFRRVEERKTAEASEKDAKRQKKIKDMEVEIHDNISMINELEKEEQELNAMEIPHVENERKRRNLTPSEARELQDMVNGIVKRKEAVKKELKERRARRKQLDDSYAKLYHYKKQ